MSRIKLYLIKNRFFSVVYFASIICIIGFYCLISGAKNVGYPVLVALFFYCLYMLVDGIIFCRHLKNIEKLSENSLKVDSARADNMFIYRAMESIHEKYNMKITRLIDENTEDKRFTSGCVHNIKTPVTVGSILIQRAKSGEITCGEALDGIEPEMERVNESLNMLLDIQRISEFEKDYELTEIDLKEELREIINSNKRLFINSNIFPAVEGESVGVLTDKKWNAVLINQIISNAVKYSKDGGAKHIYFSIRKVDKCVELAIRDEGIGISEYDIPRVFEAFFTGENGRKGYSASGIGLYLCKKICDRLNQKIRLENAEEGGCRVTITYLTKL